MNFYRGVFRPTMELVIRFMFHVDAEELEKLPARGPLIAYTNHTSQFEAPILAVGMRTRPFSGWGKAEAWKNPLMRWVFSNWGMIPVRRGEADTAALRAAILKVGEGAIFGLAPEGTRNRTGKLLRAQPGAVMLAMHSGAALQPIAHWGLEKFGENIKRLRRTQVTFRVGKKFNLDARGEKVTREVRQQMVDEMMYQLAALLPEEYRGAYSDFSKASTKYLKFDEAGTGNADATAD